MRLDVEVIHQDPYKDSYSSIYIDNTGHFTNNIGERIRYPLGFFDVTPSTMLEV